MVPEWHAKRMWLIGTRPNTTSVQIQFGTFPDGPRKGESINLDIRVRWPEALMIDAYVHSLPGAVSSVFTLADLPNDQASDDDGGDMLTAPSAADSLADMTTIGGVQ